FAAIACADADPSARVIVLEKGPQFLAKVKISGGGRCNVTHALFARRDFARHYPRGERALIGPFNQFDSSDTVAWFAARGVPLKAESDGRMFPVSNSSQTIVDCLVETARRSGVELRCNCDVEQATRSPGNTFELKLSGSDAISCDRLLLATGGCRTPKLGQMAVSLGHTLEPPVPSLFTFLTDCEWLRGLAGISVENIEASVPESDLSERGPLLVTHWGFSGPAILRISAWGARTLHDRNYRFPLLINWLPNWTAEKLAAEFQSRRNSQPARQIVNSSFTPLPLRLWESLVTASGIGRETRWAALSRSAQHKLIQQLLRSEFQVTGKSLNKDEFVTCGGVRLNEVNFKTMESRITPGLHFAGELLDIDGLTGGFNFQAAWTTGWIAGRSMATC
ncbi:MAG TPA: NAD(P)/FAD-dependent oxidoreductase, partial [Candidatus Paceibacterota bacterium]|nr:NAD(P)/FAD-dependent oxidoreductase [Candidatus Paceibacterota bacterium]